MTAEELTQRGYCCGLGCKKCPYYPRHKYGNTVLAKIIKKESIKYNTVNKDQKLMEEAYSKILEADVERLAQQDPREVYDDTSSAQDEDNKLRDEGYNLLEQAFRKFYEYGYTGSADSNAEVINQKIVQMLNNLEVDDRDLNRFADTLMSIILGQITRGHSDV